MGFPATTTYRLTFEDPGLEGLVVRVRSASIRQRAEFNALEADDDFVEWFPKMLVEWNIEDSDGAPVPTTAEGIRAVDWDIVNAIMEAWRNAKRVRPPIPLEQPSPAGDPALEASMPMAAAS